MPTTLRSTYCGFPIASRRNLNPQKLGVYVIKKKEEGKVKKGGGERQEGEGGEERKRARPRGQQGWEGEREEEGFIGAHCTESVLHRFSYLTI